MNFECEFCKSILKNKGALVTHQKTAKYCLKLRDKETDYICIYCNKNFSRQNNLDSHLFTCKSKLLKDEIDKETELHQIIKSQKEEYETNLKSQKEEYEAKLKSQKEEYEAKLKSQRKSYETIIRSQTKASTEITKKIIETPSIINNNNTYTSKFNCDNKYNIETPLNLEDAKHIEKVFNEKLTISDCYEGQVGVAKFVAREFLTDDNNKPKYQCTDASRGHFVFKTEDGKYKKDLGGKYLIKKIYEPMVKTSKRICNKPLKNAEEISDNMRYEDDEISLTETELENREYPDDIAQKEYDRYLSKPIERIADINNKEKNIAFKSVIAEEMQLLGNF